MSGSAARKSAEGVHLLEDNHIFDHAVWQAVLGDDEPAMTEDSSTVDDWDTSKPTSMIAEPLPMKSNTGAWLTPLDFDPQSLASYEFLQMRDNQYLPPPMNIHSAEEALRELREDMHDAGNSSDEDQKSASADGSDYKGDKLEASRRRNRDHARKSRLRKKLYIEQLQRAVARLTHEKQRCEHVIRATNQTIQQVQLIEEANRRLILQNRALTSYLRPDLSEEAQTATLFLELMTAGSPVEVTLRCCTPDAEFHCQTMPYKTVAEFVTATKYMSETIFSHYKYLRQSAAIDGPRVTLINVMQATHDKYGGPVPPSVPPRSVRTLVIYTFLFNQIGQIQHIAKVYDVYSFSKQLGWPMQEDIVADLAKLQEMIVSLQLTSL